MMENIYILISILSIFCGAMFFLTTVLYMRPIEAKLELIQSTIEKMNSTLETIKNDAREMRTDISVLQRDLKTAFNYIDELKAEIKELKEK